MIYGDTAILAAAKAAHEVNRAYSAFLGEPPHLPWEQAPDWQRTACITGVRNALENPNITAEEVQTAWRLRMEAEGWKYGEAKDPRAKTHPYLLPFKDLPREIQTKDVIYLAVIRQVAEAVSQSGTGRKANESNLPSLLMTLRALMPNARWDEAHDRPRTLRLDFDGGTATVWLPPEGSETDGTLTINGITHYIDAVDGISVADQVYALLKDYARDAERAASIHSRVFKGLHDAMWRRERK